MIRLEKSQEVYCRIIQKQLQLNTIKKYLKKVIYLQKKCNTPNQPSTFRTKNRVEINDDSRGTHNTNSQTKFKASMLKSSLCDYSDAYILVSGTITVFGTETDDAGRAADIKNKQATFKNCAPFIDGIIF